MLSRLNTLTGNPLLQASFFLFLLLCVFTPSVCHQMDCIAFRSWCLYGWEYGIGNTYQCPSPEMNYPPLICYILRLFAWFQGSPENVTHNFRFFKLIFLAADFLAAFLVVRFVDRKENQLLFLLLLIANPVFIYNSYVWGQVDGFLSLLVLLSFLFAYRGQLLLASSAWVLAVSFKLQAIMFAPLLALFFLDQLAHLSMRRLLMIIGVCTALLMVICWPFLLADQLSKMFKSVIRTLDSFPQVSWSAYNVWFFLVGLDGMALSDRLKFGLLTYKQAGLLMFALAFALAVLPLLISIFRKMFLKKPPLETTTLWLAAYALVPLSFFYFNTQMHERYSHTAFVFVAAYAFTTKRVGLYLLFCAAYFSNVEGLLGALGFPNYRVFYFQPAAGAGMYALLLLAMFFYLYHDFIHQLKQNGR